MGPAYRGNSFMLKISNDGPLIVSTNFWETELEQLGFLFVSVNAAAIRLLVPRQHEATIKEMATAKIVCLHRPRNPSRYAFRLLFMDGSDNPFFMDFDERQIDRMPAREDDGREDLEFTAWTQPRRGTPHEALRRPAAFRTVPRLQ